MGTWSEKAGLCTRACGRCASDTHACVLSAVLSRCFAAGRGGEACGRAYVCGLERKQPQCKPRVLTHAGLCDTLGVDVWAWRGSAVLLCYGDAESGSVSLHTYAHAHARTDKT